MRSSQEEIIKTIENDWIRTALVRFVSAASDTKIDVGDEVLIFREKYVPKWEGPYMVARS